MESVIGSYINVNTTTCNAVIKKQKTADYDQLIIINQNYYRYLLINSVSYTNLPSMDVVVRLMLQQTARPKQLAQQLDESSKNDEQMLEFIV